MKNVPIAIYESCTYEGWGGGGGSESTYKIAVK